jgi:hypothetical protein
VGTSGRRAWVGATLLVGAAYFLIGRGFALPASHVRVWRLAAWVLSGGAYAAHIAYERLRLGSSPRVTAWRAALAVAIGAFALALAGMIHSLSTGSGFRPMWLLALAVWPAVTAVPAFLVAVVAAAVLAHPRWNKGAE